MTTALDEYHAEDLRMRAAVQRAALEATDSADLARWILAIEVKAKQHYHDILVRHNPSSLTSK